MKWLLRFGFLLAFAVLPVMAHANALLPPVPLPLAPKPLPFTAPEFDLATITGSTGRGCRGRLVFSGTGAPQSPRLARTNSRSGNDRG